MYSISTSIIYKCTMLFSSVLLLFPNRPITLNNCEPLIAVVVVLSLSKSYSDSIIDAVNNWWVKFVSVYWQTSLWQYRYYCYTIYNIFRETILPYFIQVNSIAEEKQAKVIFADIFTRFGAKNENRKFFDFALSL